jgi:hypothetical protein
MEKNMIHVNRSVELNEMWEVPLKLSYSEISTMKWQLQVCCSYTIYLHNICCVVLHYLFCGHTYVLGNIRYDTLSIFTLYIYPLSPSIHHPLDVPPSHRHQPIFMG